MVMPQLALTFPLLQYDEYVRWSEDARRSSFSEAPVDGRRYVLT